MQQIILVLTGPALRWDPQSQTEPPGWPFVTSGSSTGGRVSVCELPFVSAAVSAARGTKDLGGFPVPTWLPFNDTRTETSADDKLICLEK